MHLDNLLKEIYLVLVGKDDINNNIVRKHTRKLESLGDLSFPLNIKSWHKLANNCDKATNIFEYSSKLNNCDINEETLINISKQWRTTIHKCVIIKDNCHLFVDRLNLFNHVLVEVYKESEAYGKFNFNAHSKGIIIKTNCDDCNDPNGINLSDLRVKLLAQITENVLKFNGCQQSDVQNDEIFFTNKLCKAETNQTIILCGVVLNKAGSKDVETTAEQFYKQRSVDMRLMAEHKYGLRVTAQPNWQEFFDKLGEAAVTFELVQNKPSQSTTIDFNDHYSKNASFILYNCARLEALFNEFDKKVIANIFPQLPPIELVNFKLLTQPEEWELLFVHVLQFPHTIKNIIQDIFKSQLNTHQLVAMLSRMCSLFSVYYRRVRILTDPRTHLFPVLHARLYLLRAVKQVLHTGLLLLNIQPVKQM